MNDIEKQLLEEISANLKDFVNTLHDSFGENVYLGEDSKRQLDEINVREKEFNAFFANRVDWLKKEIDDLESKIAGETGAAKDFDQIRLDRLKKLLQKQRANDVKRADEYNRKKQEIQKLTAEQKERIKDKVKEGFKKLNSYMAPAKLSNGLAHTQILEALIEKYKNDMALAQTMYTRVSAKLNDPDEKANAASLRKERNTLYSNIKKMASVITSLTDFMTTYEELNDIYSNDNIFDNLSAVENCFYKFADALDAIEETVDYNLLTVNIKENPNGTFTVDMSCGYRFMEPPLILNREELTSEKIDKNLRLFADRLSTKSNFTLDNLLQSDVVLKHNNDFVKKGDLKSICDATDKIRTGRLDDVMTNNAQQLGDGNQPAQPGDGNQPAQPGDGNQPAQPGDGNQPAQPGDGNQPAQPGDGNQPAQPGDGNQPAQPGDGNQPAQPGDGNQPAQPGDGNQPAQPGDGNQPAEFDDDDFDMSDSIVERSDLPELDAQAMKVNSKRNARSKFYNKLKGTALLAAVGLGLAGPSLGIGVAGAMIAAGIGVAGMAREAYVKLKENIKYGARKHKMKKLAEIMSDETGYDIRFDMDLEKRKAGFKLGDSKEFLTTEDLRSLPEGVDDQIIDIFENGGKTNKRFSRFVKGVESLNKYRGKGEGANSFKENRFKNFPRITFDNVTAAFADFGGVKSWKELNDYQFDYNEIIQARREELEEDVLTNENDNIEEATPDQLVEEIATQQENNNSMQQQNLGDQEPTQVQQQSPGEPIQTPQSGDGNQPAQPGDGDQQQPAADTQQQNAPVVVQPLGPSTVDPAVAELQFPQDVQKQLKEELTGWIRSEVQDPTNGIEVADKLEEAIKGRKDELSEQSKIDLVNIFHEEVKFTAGQMEKFDFICRNDRTLTDFEIREELANIEEVRATQGEVMAGNAVAEFLRNHQNLTKEDAEALKRLDVSGNLISDELINDLFNGRSVTR